MASIDPSRPGQAQLVYSTYFGSGGAADRFGGEHPDLLEGLAVDKAGRFYVCGLTSSPNFPVTKSALQTTNPGAASPLSKQGIPVGSGFFAVIDPNQAGSSQLIYSTYLGISLCQGISVDGNGLAYLTGETVGTDLPLTRNAFQTQDELLSANVEASGFVPFVTVIDPARSGRASLIYSTLLGGNHQTPNGQGDVGQAIAPGPGGLIYVAGDVSTSDFPVTVSAFQSSIVPAPMPSCCSQNEFLTVLNPALPGRRQLVYSTYLGGQSDTFPTSLGVDGSGVAYVLGGGDINAATTDAFPTTPGAFQRSAMGGVFATIVKINPFANGKASLLYSTLFDVGGDSGDNFYYATNLAPGPEGLVYLAGRVVGSGFPITPDAFEPNFAGTGSPPGASFLTILDPLISGSASVVYSTYLNSASLSNASPNAMSVDAAGRAYLAGSADPSSFPITNAYDPSGDLWVGVLAPPIPANIPTPPPPPTPTPTKTPRPTPRPKPTPTRRRTPAPTRTPKAN